jgi:hypothetical protein
MITLISTGYNILIIKLTESILLAINLSLISRGFFPYCAVNIRCNLTGDFVSASHITQWDFPVLKSFFKENQQQRSWCQNSILKIQHGNIMSAQVYLQQNLFR